MDGDALADEGPEYDVVGDEDEVEPAFAIARVVNVIASWRRRRMGYE